MKKNTINSNNSKIKVTESSKIRHSNRWIKLDENANAVDLSGIEANYQLQQQIKAKSANTNK